MIKPPNSGAMTAPSSAGDNSAMQIPRGMPGAPAAFAAATRLPFMPAMDPRLAYMARMGNAAAAAAQPPAGGGVVDRAEMMRALAAYGAAPPAALYPMCITPRAYMEQLMAARQTAAATAAVAAAAHAAGASRMYPGSLEAYAAAAHPFLRDPTAGLAYYQQRAAIAAAQAAAAAQASAAGSSASGSPPPPVHLKLTPADFQQKELERFQQQQGGDTRQPVDKREVVVVEEKEEGAAVSKDHSQARPERKSAASDSKAPSPSALPSTETPTSPAAHGGGKPSLGEPSSSSAGVDHSGLEALSRIARMRSHAPLYSPRGDAAVSAQPPPCVRATTPQPSPSPRGSSFMNAMGGGGGGEMDDAASRGRRRERWTAEEHERFLDGLNKYGRKWTKIQSLLPHKTASQIRVHAYSFFSKLMQDSPGAYAPFLQSPVTSPTAAGELAAASQRQEQQAGSSVYPAPPAAVEREGSEDGADLLEVAEIISTLRKSRQAEAEAGRRGSGEEEAVEAGRKRRMVEQPEGAEESQKRSHAMNSLVRQERQ